MSPEEKDARLMQEQPNGEVPPEGEEQLFDEEEDLAASDDHFLAVVAKAMPWVISLLFHVGLFLVMMFFVMIVLQEAKPEQIIIPDAVMSDNPGGAMNPTENNTNKTQNKTATQRKNITRQTKVSADAGKTARPLDVIGVGGGASGASSMGMKTAGSGGPKSSFFGSGGNAYNVVYVIDRSGSMIDTFDQVKLEMLRSIGRLRSSQYFHIILFAEGRPIEDNIKRLKLANRDNKIEAGKFLENVVAEGQTNPVPALERAFQVLAGARKAGKLIYLLTDGVFDDNTKVLNAIAEKNQAKKVYINTFLYGNRPPEAVDVMTKIADQNGGKFTFVESEE